jgi:NAD(P)-dependent dehydrogenase (short-subunit alcohol dehydrogenase family)
LANWVEKRLKGEKEKAVAEDPDPQREARLLDKNPIGRSGTPEEIAEAVIWLCSADSSFATGLIMSVDGGYTAQ